MPRTALTGTRIRARRNLRGLRQAELAREVGISPSFLNLIEHNRRKVNPQLLEALAEALGVSADALIEDQDGRLIEGARAAAQRSDAAGTELERIDEFTSRFPGWAKVLAETQARVERLERVIESLNDRMTHDPYLGEALHEIISAVTSVQSTASILTDAEEIDADWQARFHRNILQDSARLAEGAVALVNYLDTVQTDEAGLAAPLEEVEAWLTRQGFHLPEIEQGLTDMDVLVRGQVELSSEASRVLAQSWLAQFAADAAVLPLEALSDALSDTGLAPEALAARFGVPFDQVLRRLALMPEKVLQAVGLPPLGLVICDSSGTMVFRRAVEGFRLPRFGGGCPLWPLYQALQRPHVPLRQSLLTAGRLGRRYLAYAVAVPITPPAFEAPSVLRATMLIVPQPAGAAQAEPAPVPVGSSCRTCAQLECIARREPSILVTGA
ncbi:MAG: helix-turn-helix domain-containing protein [Rhodobacteraceae bacterium]|nr:MAG: helix-turn-helix domain-containing protein [Paracoccaceae bacterium]